MRAEPIRQDLNNWRAAKVKRIKQFKLRCAQIRSPFAVCAPLNADKWSFNTVC
jgi:hypothetical protein